MPLEPRAVPAPQIRAACPVPERAAAAVDAGAISQAVAEMVEEQSDFLAALNERRSPREESGLRREAREYAEIAMQVKNGVRRSNVGRTREP